MGHGLADAERIADRQHDVADARLVHAAERDGRQVGHVDLEHGEVGFLVDADDLGARSAAVGERDFDLVCPVDDMLVR